MKTFFYRGTNSIGGVFVAKAISSPENSFEQEIDINHMLKQPPDYLNFYNKMWADSGIPESSAERTAQCPLQIFSATFDSVTFIDVQKFNSTVSNPDDDFKVVSDKFESCKLTIKKGEYVNYIWNNISYELSYKNYVKEDTVADNSYLDLPQVVTENGEKVVADLIIANINKNDEYWTMPITSGTFLKKDYINFRTQKWVDANAVENQKEDCPLQVFSVTPLSLTFNDVRILAEKKDTDSFKMVGEILDRAKVTIKKDEEIPTDFNEIRHPVFVEWNGDRYQVSYSWHAPVRYQKKD